MVERDGVAGVSHRSVASEAGVPPSSALYYFATLDDLLVAALEVVAAGYTDQITALLESDADPLEALARLVVDAGGPGRGRAIVERELTTLASRRPALREAATSWRRLAARTAGRVTDDEAAVEAVVAITEGLCTQQLLGVRTYEVTEVHDMLRRAAGQRRRPRRRPDGGETPETR